MGRRIIYSHDTNLSGGVAILFKKNLDYVIAKKRFDCEGCFVSLDLSIQEKKYKLLNIYASNNIKNQADFFKRMKNILAFEDGCNGGRFRCVMDDTLDKRDPRRAELYRIKKVVRNEINHMV